MSVNTSILYVDLFWKPRPPGPLPTRSKSIYVTLLSDIIQCPLDHGTLDFKYRSTFFQGGRVHWAVYNTSPQSLK